MISGMILPRRFSLARYSWGVLASGKNSRKWIPCGKKPRGKNPMGIRIVEELRIVWEYCVPTKLCCYFFLFFFERQRSNTSKQQIQMTLFEFKILFDPTFGLQGGDKVQSKTFGQRVVISNSCKARCLRTLPFFGGLDEVVFVHLFLWGGGGGSILQQDEMIRWEIVGNGLIYLGRIKLSRRKGIGYFMFGSALNSRVN